jgi:hypothetical protein
MRILHFSLALGDYDLQKTFDDIPFQSFHWELRVSKTIWQVHDMTTRSFPEISS